MTARRRGSVLILLAVAVVALATPPAEPRLGEVETVRGVVRRQLADGRLIPGSLLEVKIWPEASAEAGSRTTVTDWDGLYYFELVSPGGYKISVGEKGRGAIQVFRYDIRHMPFTDVPPIILAAPLKDYRTAYKSALRSIDLRDWSGAAFVLRQVLALHPETADSRKEQIRLTGNYFEPYRPHFYLGLALLRLSDCEGALSEWEAGESLGPIESRYRKIQNEGRNDCEARPRGKPRNEPAN